MSSALLLFMLGGCSLGPRYVRPEAPVAASWPVQAPPGDVVGWRQRFTDPQLQSLIEAALVHNRDLRVAVLNIEAARARYRVQRADRLPTLNLEAGALYSGGFDGGEVSSLYEVGGLVPAFELDLFGRVKSLSDAALARYLATEEGARTVHISLVAQVAQAWLAERAFAEQLDYASRSLAAREASFVLDQQRLDAGVANEVTFRQSQTLVESARASVAALRRGQAQAGNALTLLTGGAALADLQALPLSDQQIAAPLPAGLPSDLLLQRPDIRAAEQQLRAAHADIGAARAAFFPRISLTATAGFASTELIGLFAAGSGGWSLLPGLTQPVFQGGRLRANLRLAEVQREIALAAYEQTVQTAFREVADALVAREPLDQQVQALERLREAEARRLELGRQRFEAGVAGNLELLDAERSLFEAERALVLAHQLRLANAIDLYKALGGGLTP